MLLKESISENEIYYYENDFLISRKEPDIYEQFILQMSRRRAMLLKESISQNEKDFPISRNGLDLSSSRSTVGD